MECEYIRDITHEELKIMKRHLDKHAWFRRIADKAEALKDFIEIYGEIMREIYCDKACPKHGNCEAYMRNLEKQGIPLNRTQQIVMPPEQLESRVSEKPNIYRANVSLDGS